MADPVLKFPPEQKGSSGFAVAAEDCPPSRAAG